MAALDGKFSMQRFAEASIVLLYFTCLIRLVPRHHEVILVAEDLISATAVAHRKSFEDAVKVALVDRSLLYREYR